LRVRRSAAAASRTCFMQRSFAWSRSSAQRLVS
jgi:hypothetical protein